MRYMLVCLSILAVVLLWTTFADAGGCRVATTVHHAPTVAVPYYPLTPTVLPVQTVFQVAPEIVQQRIAEVKQEQDEANADKVAEKVYQKLLKTIQQATPEPPPVTNASGSDDPLAGVRVVGLDSGPSPSGGDVQAAANVLQAQGCVKCHGAGERVDVTLLGLQRMTPQQREKLVASMAHDEDAKPMPPKAPRVAAAQRRVVERWALR